LSKPSPGPVGGQAPSQPSPGSPSPSLSPEDLMRGLMDALVQDDWRAVDWCIERLNAMGLDVGFSDGCGGEVVSPAGPPAPSSMSVAVHTALYGGCCEH